MAGHFRQRQARIVEMSVNVGARLMDHAGVLAVDLEVTKCKRGQQYRPNLLPDLVDAADPGNGVKIGDDLVDVAAQVMEKCGRCQNHMHQDVVPDDGGLQYCHAQRPDEGVEKVVYVGFNAALEKIIDRRAVDLEQFRLANAVPLAVEIGRSLQAGQGLDKRGANVSYAPLGCTASNHQLAARQTCLLVNLCAQFSIPAHHCVAIFAFQDQDEFLQILLDQEHVGVAFNHARDVAACPRVSLIIELSRGIDRLNLDHRDQIRSCHQVEVKLLGLLDGLRRRHCTHDQVQQQAFPEIRLSL